jgi:cell division protein FtsB
MIRWLSTPWRWLRRSDQLAALRDENVRLRLQSAVLQTQKTNLEKNLQLTLEMLRPDAHNFLRPRKRR